MRKAAGEAGGVSGMEARDKPNFFLGSKVVTTIHGEYSAPVKTVKYLINIKWQCFPCCFKNVLLNIIPTYCTIFSLESFQKINKTRILLGVDRVVETNLIGPIVSQKNHRGNCTNKNTRKKTHISRDEAWGPYAAKIFDLFSVPLDKRISLHEFLGLQIWSVEAGKLVGFERVIG